MAKKQRKKKRQINFPTFGNDAFFVPAVIAGIFYVYNFMQMMAYEARLAEEHKLDVVISYLYNPTTYDLNPWPIVVPFFIFIICMAIYSGSIDVVLVSLSKKGRGKFLLAIGKKLTSGVMEQWEWSNKK
jgi:hypothetical protein